MEAECFLGTSSSFCPSPVLNYLLLCHIHCYHHIFEKYCSKKCDLQRNEINVRG